MVSKLKLFFVIFLIITTFITAMSFSIRFIDINNILLLTGSFLGLGLVLSAIVFLVISAIIKAPMKKTEESVISEEKELPHLDERVTQLLSIFQKKGRLIDFLFEDISAFDDKQVGSAVRNIHKGCKEVLKEYTEIKPVMKEEEGSEITMEKGFDPSTIRLTGNIVGEPPFKGILRHCGWRISMTKMPDLPKKQDLSIIEPAELEIL